MNQEQLAEILVNSMIIIPSVLAVGSIVEIETRNAEWRKQLRRTFAKAYYLGLTLIIIPPAILLAIGVELYSLFCYLTKREATATDIFIHLARGLNTWRERKIKAYVRGYELVIK